MNIRSVVSILLVFCTVALSGCGNGPTDNDGDVVEGVTLHGIDISHHNVTNYAPIDWAQVRAAGYAFAFVKATDGYNGCWTDPTFTTNMEAGYRAGMLIGAYHFARPDLNRDAAVEAQCFLKNAGKYLKTGYLRPVLDVERGAELGQQALSDWVHRWMDTIKAHTGVEPILYTYSSYTRNFDVSVTRYALWLAHYTYDPDAVPNPGLWSVWEFWQYSDRGSVPGVADPTIDLNVFNGGLERLQREFVIK